MKNILALAVLSALLFHTSPADAYVRRVMACDSTRGLQVIVIDNQGLAPIRTTRFVALVEDAQGNRLADYQLVGKRAGSISFGRWHYVDKKSLGQHFDLALGSTNFHNIEVSTTLPNGTVFRDENLSCKK